MYNFDKEKKVLSELTKRVYFFLNCFQQGDDADFLSFPPFYKAAVDSDPPAVLSKNAIPNIYRGLPRRRVP